MKGKSRAQAGFTLIELLCSMAVMALILVITSQMINSAMTWSKEIGLSLDSSAEAREVFQRLRFDFNAQDGFPGKNFNIVKQSGNDVVEVLADVRSQAPARYTKVSYQVNNAEDAVSGNREPVLFRSLTPIEWTVDPTDLFASIPTPDGAGRFSESCFRLEAVLLCNDGTLVSAMPADSADVKAVIVGIAMLEADIRKRLTDAEVQNLAASLADIPDGKTPLEYWEATAFDAKIRGSVRFYQQTFYLRNQRTASR